MHYVLLTVFVFHLIFHTLSYPRPAGQNGLEALFLRHEGYCGALGAFLSTLENEDTAEHAPSST